MLPKSAGKELIRRSLVSKKEQVKTILDFIKVTMLALLTALFSIFAFVVVNIENINTIQVAFSAVGIVFIAIALYFLVRYLIKKLNELGEME